MKLSFALVLFNALSLIDVTVSTCAEYLGTCNYHVSCCDAMDCIEGVCECSSNSDCNDGENCFAGLCEPDGDLTIVSSDNVKSSYVRIGQRSLIEGGETVDGDKYRYMASVGNCGAVLVAKNVFLTAAHCENPLRVVLKENYSSSKESQNSKESKRKLQRKKRTKTKAPRKANESSKERKNAGRRKLPGSTKWHQSRSLLVIDVLDHPNWRKDKKLDGSYSKSYDFRLLRVSGFPGPEPIDLDDGNNGYTNTDEPLTIMGWGKTGVDKKLSEDLLDADVNVLDLQTCKQAYKEFDDTNLDKTVMFCAGKSSNGTYIGTCEGDSGGPIVKRDVDGIVGNDLLVGIVSFAANECGNSDHPTVFAKVSGVYEWLVESINNWDCSEQLESRERLLGASKVPDSNLPHLVSKGLDPSGSLGICEGDCDMDQDCDGELICYQRNMDTDVPGCVNGGSGDIDRFDYCVQPAPDSPFVDSLKDMKCAYILNDESIREAVKMYLSTPNLAILVYSDPKYWVTTKVTNMNRLFSEAGSFNEDISQWDMSKVTSTSYMFYYATSFNQDLSQWDMSKVTDTTYMFGSATSFNQDVSQWDMSKVTNMKGMFYHAFFFNQDVSQWDMSKVTNMRNMFWYATSFNQDLSQWDMSKVTDMKYMFEGATSFNQNLCSWKYDIQDASFKRNMFHTTSCPYETPSDTSVCHSCIPPPLPHLVDNGWSP